MGKRLAQKIEEIISSGDLRRLEAVDKEKQAVLTAFTNIHGVGQIVAEQFYAQVGGWMGAWMGGWVGGWVRDSEEGSAWGQLLPARLVVYGREGVSGVANLHLNEYLD